MGTAVVTGANSGIGLATAIRLAVEGHHVFAGMRDLDKAADLLAAAEEAHLDSIEPVRIDVTNDHVVEMAFGQVLDKAGPVDILVNNAGIAQGIAIEDASLASFQDHIDTNYIGAIRCIKQVLPSMRERGTGAIVNVTSVAGRWAQVTMGAYTGSKFALEGLSEVLAQELATKGVRVIIIEPGTIDTPIFAKAVPPPRDTQYREHYERTATYFLKTGMVAPGPEIVAEAIAEALADDDPKLRYAVAPDAHALLAARERVSDEEILDMAKLTSTAEWVDAVRHHTGLDLQL